MISPFNVSTTPISLSPVLTTSENTKSSSSLGALLGGVVGGLVFVALLVAAGFIYHRRRRNRHVAVRLPDYDEHLVSNMQQGTSTQWNMYFKNSAYLTHRMGGSSLRRNG
jgi:amino acid transporter